MSNPHAVAAAAALPEGPAPAGRSARREKSDAALGFLFQNAVRKGGSVDQLRRIDFKEDRGDSSCVPPGTEELSPVSEKKGGNSDEFCHDSTRAVKTKEPSPCLLRKQIKKFAGFTET
jgi:hypothetical protein